MTETITVKFNDEQMAEIIYKVTEKMMLDANRIEVVRCKDCKYNGAWCDIQDIEWTEKGKPIEFCSYGERKEDKHTSV